jgi:hypothetical protein
LRATEKIERNPSGPSIIALQTEVISIIKGGRFMIRKSFGLTFAAAALACMAGIAYAGYPVKTPSPPPKYRAPSTPRQ